MPWTIVVAVLAAALATAQPIAVAGGPLRPGNNTGQPKFKPEELCNLEGTVKDEQTDQPIGKASLLLYRVSGSQPYSSSSDASGKFAFKGVEPGQYRMSVSRTGYARLEYGASSGSRPGTTLRLEKSQALKGLDVKLTPHAVITGRVVDSDGEPVAWAQVQALRSSFRSGKKQWLPFGNASTNDLGEYRMFGLSAGRYLVSAISRSFDQGDGAIDASGREGSEGPVLTYHPGVTESEQGSQVNVPKGGRVQGIDIALAKGKGYVVKGRVTGMPNRSTPVMAMLYPRNPEIGMMGLDRGFAQVQPDGTFEIRRVRPGLYTVNVQVQDQESRLSGRADVDVVDGDAGNVSVILQAGFEVKGTVRVEGGGSAKLDECRVSLTPKVQGGFLYFGGGGGAIKDDGSFALRDIRQGKYTVRLYKMPDGHYLKSARMGPADAMADDFEIGGPGELELVLSSKAAKVEGSVTNAKGEAASATVLVIGTDKNRQGTQNVTTDQSGRFTVQGLAPGDYSVIAIEDYEPGMDQVPEFLKLNSKFVEKVTLREGSAEAKTLKSTLAILE
ncbi:MAG: carboxypeptidase regulatory-like domain-containing protein [Bryobacteraceae bacterium]